MKAKDLIQELNQYAELKRAKNSSWFFKTGKDQYGEGDKFIGVRVPIQRQIVKSYTSLPFKELDVLFNSKFHEHRLSAVFVLINKFNLATDKSMQTEIYNYYMKQLDRGRINNWDIVDSSAHKIVGRYLIDKPRHQLIELANSNKLWHQRVAIIATASFIEHGQYKDTLLIAELLMSHPEDLIHKAVGWMLREVGKRNQSIEIEFLNQHYKNMPRTMLRYAVEKFPEPLRQQYLKSEIS